MPWFAYHLLYAAGICEDDALIDEVALSPDEKVFRDAMKLKIKESAGQ